MDYFGITIVPERDELLTDYARGMLMDFYSINGETSPQELFGRASIAWSTFKGTTDYDLAQRLYDAVSQKWFMFSSPVLSNAPDPKSGKSTGMPISCFLAYVPDTVEGLIEHSSELRWLSVMGGGVGGHWNDIRSVSEKSPGPIPFLATVDADMTAYKQGKTRKGSYAAYINVNHPDILEFMQIRVPTGDDNRKCLNLHNGVNLSNDFMEAVINNEEYELMDPNKGGTGEFLKARKVWQQLLEIRFRTGEPYFNFIDHANDALPEPLRRKGLKINGSNLCNEIHLPTDETRTAVCCLSSLNLEEYDNWKDTSLVSDLITMLDNVLEYFIENAPTVLQRAIYSATQERSLGLGAMGFHSLLQKHKIPFESNQAVDINNEVFKLIKYDADQQSRKLAVTRGEYLDGLGTGRRNSHLLAVAPNASSGILLSTSPSIEPLKANAYTHRTRAGSFLVKNKYLEKLLETYGKNDQNTWSSIITTKGSVQHLGFLSEEEKDIFKTASELDQAWVIDHAADRQQYICQGQSVNLFFLPGVEKSLVSRIHLRAWQRGLKGLYYLRTEAKSRAENVSEKVERNSLVENKTTIIYGKANCPFCIKTKEELFSRGIAFEYIDLEEINKTAAQVTGRAVTTVPQIYLAEAGYIGGYEQLMEYFGNGQQENEECKACEG